MTNIIEKLDAIRQRHLTGREILDAGASGLKVAVFYEITQFAFSVTGDAFRSLVFASMASAGVKITPLLIRERARRLEGKQEEQYRETGERRRQYAQEEAQYQAAQQRYTQVRERRKANIRLEQSGYYERTPKVMLTNRPLPVLPPRT